MKAIALDAMGGDFAPQATVAGAVQAARAGIPIILVGEEARLADELAKYRASGNLTLCHAPDLIDMSEHAADVRARKSSSIVRALELLRSGEASACVSMGHSGATMAAALMLLGRIKGVSRPAILTEIPSQNGRVALLDAGANADCKPRHLQHFAVMGAAYARIFFDHPEPLVGLLSIGEEDDKGNELTRKAHELLRKTRGINFYGNVEGRDLFRGTTEVVVADGFTGNVALKLAEGEAKVIFAWVREALSSSLLAKIGAALVKPALKKVAARVDPDEYGGAPLLGVNGFVFIGHGASGEKAVFNALKTSQRAVEAGLVQRLEEAMLQLRQEDAEVSPGKIA